MSGLDYEQAVLAGGASGIMAACLDVVVPYLHERRQFGSAIGEFQLMQAKLADMYVTLMRPGLTFAVGQACDRGAVTRRDAAGHTLRRREGYLDGRRSDPGPGRKQLRDYPTGRLWRDASSEIGAGTSEIRRMLIGRELFDVTGCRP